MMDWDKENLALFDLHMERCIAQVIGPMRPDAKVTIIVRAPEAKPGEAMISTNDSLSVALDALAHLVKEQQRRRH